MVAETASKVALFLVTCIPAKSFAIDTIAALSAAPPAEIASCAKAGALEESTTKAAWFGLQIAPLQRSLSDTLSPILSFSAPTQIQRPLRFGKISTERKGLLKAFPPMAPFTRLTDCAIAVEPTIRTM